MNQCLRCNKQCSVTSLFCDKCGTLLQNQELSAPGESAHIEKDISIFATSPHVAVSSSLDDDTTFDEDDIAKRITAPNPGVRSSRSQQSIYTRQTNRVEQALHRLNDAARRLAAAEPEGHRKPKSSRLSPLRDISNEIHRQSTPLPSMPEQKLFSIDDEQSDDLGGNLPDLWPWLNDGDSGEIDAESWSNRTDPLISRRFPDSVEAARIEEEDIRRVAAEGLATFTLPVTRKRTSRLRIVFASLTILAILALTIDSILVSANFLNTSKKPISTPVTANITGSPTLVLSTTNVVYGQTVTLSLQNFAPSSWVYVTRDGEDPITLNTSSAASAPNRSIVIVNAKGIAKASMYIESTWNPGYHFIEAEDLKMHYTAKSSLHIDNAGPTRPPHLVVNNLAIDLGSAPQGANSLRSLTMSNDGSGSITWSASSNQSWLLVAPNQGAFSDSQTISVAGQRANLKPGDYNGAITINSNIGMSAEIQVQMTVLALPNKGTPVLQVTPALISFTAIDGNPSPDAQSLIVSNPGSQPLHWALVQNGPASVTSGTFASANNIPVNWLLTDRTKGTTAPHATTTIQVSALSSNVLSGNYTSTLLFSADKNAINNPQSINVSLTVLPRCSLQTSTNALAFTAVSGQGSPATQTLSLSASSSCSGTSAWTATSTAPWLSITPMSGQLKGITESMVTVTVNTSALQATTYSGSITLTMTATKNTQTILVQLVVQSPPPPGAPILAVSPLNVDFTTMYAQKTISSQSVTLTNQGGSPLSWSQAVSAGNSVPWMKVSPALGTLLPNQTTQVLISVRPYLTSKTPLSAGKYFAIVAFKGLDAQGKEVVGSPQTVNVNLSVLVPCSLPVPTSNTLAFTAVQGGSNPAPQTESFSATGSCVWPVTWTLSSTLPAWLSASSSTGSFTTDGQSTSLTFAPTISGLAPGTYTTQLTISSADNGTPTTTSSQTVPVSLVVTGYTISGTVDACSDTVCTTPVPLANAALTLTDGSGANFTATADANGNYTFTNVALGTSTIKVSGSNGTTNYTGSATVNVTGDQLNFPIKTQ